MSSQITTSTKSPTNAQEKGRKNHKARRRNVSKAAVTATKPTDSEKSEPTVIDTTDSIPEGRDDTDEDEDANLCWICAEPVRFFSLSECNHRTCHVCAVRLRALYKKLDCTFCKVLFHLEALFQLLLIDCFRIPSKQSCSPRHRIELSASLM